AAVIWFPHTRVYVWFLLPVPLRLLALIFGIFMALSIFSGGLSAGGVSQIAHLSGIAAGILLIKFPRTLNFLDDVQIPGTRRRPKRVKRVSMGHPGRHTDPDDRYDDPHWRLDQ